MDKPIKVFLHYQRGPHAATRLVIGADDLQVRVYELLRTFAEGGPGCSINELCRNYEFALLYGARRRTRCVFSLDYSTLLLRTGDELVLRLTQQTALVDLNIAHGQHIAVRRVTNSQRIAQWDCALLTRCVSFTNQLSMPCLPRFTVERDYDAVCRELRAMRTLLHNVMLRCGDAAGLSASQMCALMYGAMDDLDTASPLATQLYLLMAAHQRVSTRYEELTADGRRAVEGAAAFIVCNPVAPTLCDLQVALAAVQLKSH